MRKVMALQTCLLPALNVAFRKTEDYPSQIRKRVRLQHKIAFERDTHCLRSLLGPLAKSSVSSFLPLQVLAGEPEIQTTWLEFEAG